jgi:hypothetical protein
LRYEEYGFEVDYPDNFNFSTVDFIKEFGKTNTTFIFGDRYFQVNIQICEKVKVLEQERAIIGLDEVDICGPRFFIDIAGSNYKNINEWFEEWSNNLESGYFEHPDVTHPEITLAENINIQGIEAKRITINYMSGLDTIVVFIYKNHLYYIYYDGTLRESENEVINRLESEEYYAQEEEYRKKYVDIFNQLLSTFRFID